MVATEVAKSQVAKSRAGKSEMDRKVDFISTPVSVFACCPFTY